MSALIFDGDNTLWPCNEYYGEAKVRFVEAMLREFPDTTEEEIRARFSRVDTEAAHGPLGFTQERYPTSMRTTYGLFCEERGRRVNSAVAEEMYQTGKSVFLASYAFYEGVPELLTRYRQTGVPMVLLTKGDEEIQQGKIDRNRAQEFFDLIEIVPRKNAEVFRQMSERFGGGKRVLSIGDSLRDDIHTAQEVGLGTVWVSGRKGTWGFEEGYDHVKPDHVIEHVTRLEEAVPSQGLISVPAVAPVRSRRG